MDGNAIDKFIEIAREYGESVQDVIDSATLWRQQYESMSR